MENSEEVKIIQYHNNQLGFDCPCVHRANDKIEVHDASRMPKDETELLKWKVEYNSRVDLTDQKTDCIKLLNDSEIHVSNDPPYSDDVQEWKDKRADWRRILKSEIIEEIPAKPFN